MVSQRLTKHVCLAVLRLCALALVSLLVVVKSSPVLALTQADVDAIYGDSTFYDPSTAGENGCSSASGGSPSGSTYFVGDSIGTQIKDSLAAALGGTQFQGNAVAGRNLSGGTILPDGLGAIDQDQAFIKGAGNVVIELGTNAGGFSADTVTQMISKIRGLSPNANIYWVDTAVVQRQDYAQTLDNVNSIIYSQSSTLNYKVISWNKAVFGSTADPKNINPNASDNGYIRHSDQFVHLTDQGIPAMTSLIANALKGGGTNSQGCACTSLNGSDNEEKIWNYLIAKGLTPPQAAGVMGNLQAESGFNPAAQQTPGAWDDLSDASNRAVGIAQWDSGRRPALINAAKAQNKDPKDLGFQLDYLYNESLHRDSRSFPGTPEWDGLKKQPDAASAAYYWHYNFERSNDDPNRIQNRVNFANAVLVKYGSSGSSTSGSGGSPC